MSAVVGITLLAALTLGAIGVVALVLPFRRAGAVQRQQIKWFAYGAAPSVLLGMFAQVRPYGPYLEFLGAALQLAGLGIGIFRFRLWDIDRLVTGPWSMGCSPCCSAPSTPGWSSPGAAVRRDRRDDAELGGGRGHPVPAGRRRVQQAVDLRFNRRKYDAALTIGRFSARLRDQVDLDTLSAELLVVVGHTMQPTATSLWLRPSVADSALASPPASA